MAAIANIVVADATPTNHTYLPIQASTASSTWMTDESVTYEGNSRLAMSLSPPKASRPTTRVGCVMHFPFERVVDGVTTVVEVPLFEVNGVLPKTLSKAERLKIFTMLKNFLASSVATSYFVDGFPVT